MSVTAQAGAPPHLYQYVQLMTDKIAIRQQIRKKRASLPAFRQHLASLALVRRILSNVNAIHHADRIAFYLAQDGEIDLLPLMVHCFNQGRRCYLPVLGTPDNKKLNFAEWTPRQPMSYNRYGIAEPIVNHRQRLTAAEMGLIFMPLVAFDANGNRLGMGGGYYDRSLAECCSSGSSATALNVNTGKRPVLIATGHDIQYIRYLPHDSWDIVPDMTITPGRIIKPNYISKS